MTYTFLVLALASSLSTSDASRFQKVIFTTDDGATIEGTFFKGKKDRAVVSAHGAIKQGKLVFLPECLQKEGIVLLAIDFRGSGNSKPGRKIELYYNILGGVDYLMREGFEHIALLGRNMGGGAILRALLHTTEKRIDRVILFAPGGELINSQNIKKLFIVVEKDYRYARVYDRYKASLEPKELKVYPRSSRAQHMFKSKYGNDMTDLIVRFLED
jgi:alpha-beta hydrolase superfamily lysophospholipase